MQPKNSCHITPESKRTYQGLMKMIPRGQKETLGKGHLILSEKPKSPRRRTRNLETHGLCWYEQDIRFLDVEEAKRR